MNISIEVHELDSLELISIASHTPFNDALAHHIAVQVRWKAMGAGRDRRNGKCLSTEERCGIKNIEDARFKTLDHELLLVGKLVPVWSNYMDDTLSVLHFTGAGQGATTHWHLTKRFKPLLRLQKDILPASIHIRLGQPTIMIKVTVCGIHNSICAFLDDVPSHYDKLNLILDIDFYHIRVAAGYDIALLL